MDRSTGPHQTTATMSGRSKASFTMPPAVGLFVPTDHGAINPDRTGTPSTPSVNASELQPASPVGAKVGRFASTSVPLAAGMDEFLAAISAPLPARRRGLQDDLRIEHSGESLVRAIPRGYIRGETVFGCGQSVGNDIFALNTARMRMAETLILHNAVFSPQSASVMCPGAGFYDTSLVNYGTHPGAFDSLVAMDPIYEYDAAGDICFSDAAARIDRIEAVAMPVSGTGFHNYGHFLFDGLPMAFLIKNALPKLDISLVGPPLSGWQRDILDVLGFGDAYRTLSEPAMFGRLIVPNLIAQHVSYPVRLLRPLMDALRFRLSANAERRRRIFVSRRNDRTKRVMRNRAEVEALFVDMGFEIVVPETMTFVEQVRLFAECEVVAGESGAGMANVAFCDPGTAILEIQPETFFEGWIRATSMLMALEWNVYFARSAASNAGELAFTVDPPLLRAAVERILRKN